MLGIRRVELEEEWRIGGRGERPGGTEGEPAGEQEGGGVGEGGFGRLEVLEGGRGMRAENEEEPDIDEQDVGVAGMSEGVGAEGLEEVGEGVGERERGGLLAWSGGEAATELSEGKRCARGRTSGPSHQPRSGSWVYSAIFASLNALSFCSNARVSTRISCSNP